MPRDLKIYLDDIIEAVQRIQGYTAGLNSHQFLSDKKTIDAVIRNLEIIGEAAKKLPEAIKQKYAEIEWKKIAGLRDVLIHEYFGIDPEIIWDIVQNKLPALLQSVKKIS